MDRFPVFQTERLFLRKHTIDDVSRLSGLADNRKIAARIANIPYPYPPIQASLRLGVVQQTFAKGQGHCFAIALADRDEFIGELSLHLLEGKRQIAQLAYWLGEPFWGQGYATEALRYVLHKGLVQLPYAHVVADCKVDNTASARVMEKAGMECYKRSAQQLFYRYPTEG